MEQTSSQHQELQNTRCLQEEGKDKHFLFQLALPNNIIVIVFVKHVNLPKIMCLLLLLIAVVTQKRAWHTEMIIKATQIYRVTAFCKHPSSVDNG